MSWYRWSPCACNYGSFNTCLFCACNGLVGLNLITFVLAALTKMPVVWTRLLTPLSFHFICSFDLDNKVIYHMHKLGLLDLWWNSMGCLYYSLHISCLHTIIVLRSLAFLVFHITFPELALDETPSEKCSIEIVRTMFNREYLLLSLDAMWQFAAR